MAGDDREKSAGRGGDVLHLVTAAERAAAAETEYRDAAHVEAVSMLERALELVRDRKAGGVVVALAFDDGSYGSLIPVVGNRVGHLIGAVADAQHRLIRSTEGDE